MQYLVTVHQILQLSLQLKTPLQLIVVLELFLISSSQQAHLETNKPNKLFHKLLNRMLKKVNTYLN